MRSMLETMKVKNNAKYLDRKVLIISNIDGGQLYGRQAYIDRGR